MAVIDPALELLISKAKGNELDYGFVMDCLQGYRSPRSKLGKLLDSGALIRIKKGLYVLGPLFQKEPLCLELLANLVYGPSYVSLETALSHYHLIPERVVAVTSVTSLHKKRIKTPVASFIYMHCHQKRYAVSVHYKNITSSKGYLIASPEKALCDYVVLNRGQIRSKKEMETVLFEDMRVDEEDFSQLCRKEVKAIYEAHPHSSLEILYTLLRER